MINIPKINSSKKNPTDPWNRPQVLPKYKYDPGFPIHQQVVDWGMFRNRGLLEHVRQGDVLEELQQDSGGWLEHKPNGGCLG